MDRHIACDCGHAVGMPDGDDAPVACPACGRRLAPPEGVPSAAGNSPAAPRPESPAEVLPPTFVKVTRADGGWFEANRPAVAAFVGDAVWIQPVGDPGALFRVPLSGVEVEHSPALRRLTLSPGGASATGSTTMLFGCAADEALWREAFHARPSTAPAATAPGAGSVVSAVCLRGSGHPGPSHSIGPLEALGPSDAAADAALQLRAAVLGADAIVGVRHDAIMKRSRTFRYASGTAVRASDEESRERLRSAWYAEKVGSLVRRCLVILSIVVACDVLAESWLSSGAGGRITLPALGGALAATLPWIAWPFILVLFLGWSHWPGFLRPLAVAVLAPTTLSGLASLLAHLAALARASVGGMMLGVLFNPLMWGIVVWGAVLAMSLWRLAAARDRLQGGGRASVSAAGVWMPLAASLLYACVLSAYACKARYESSTYLLQPGVNLRAESVAGAVLDEGIAALERNDIEAAERALQQARLQWERLTEAPPVPLHYHTNLGYALNNLSWLREAQGRTDEAQRYAKRCVAMERTVTGGGPDDAEFREVLGTAKEALARLEGNAAAGAFAASDNAARLKYEEAIVRADEDVEDACRLMNEAIEGWERMLGGSVGEGDRSILVQRLGYAHLRLAAFEEAAGNLGAARTELQKGIDRLERLKDSESDGVLLARNLGAAREHLDALHEREFREGVERLTAAERFDDAIDAYRRGIAELEGMESDSARQRLAHRLDDFAWFLVHCPVERFRDGPTALLHARRAADLDPDDASHQYTLAMVAYRNGAWKESLAALEQEEAIVGSSDSGDCFLRAMILVRLGRRDDAAAAFRRGKEGLDELERRARENPLFRLRHDMIRPVLDAMRQEAEDLLEGRDVAWRSGPWSAASRG